MCPTQSKFIPLPAISRNCPGPSSRHRSVFDESRSNFLKGPHKKVHAEHTSFLQSRTNSVMFFPCHPKNNEMKVNLKKKHVSVSISQKHWKGMPSVLNMGKPCTWNISATVSNRWLDMQKSLEFLMRHGTNTALGERVAFCVTFMMKFPFSSRCKPCSSLHNLGWASRKIWPHP